MAKIYKEDTWTVIEAQVHGRPVFVRTRADLPADLDKHLYSHLVVISWAYKSMELGMPSVEENEQMIGVEEALLSAVEAEDVGVLAACVTGNGSKHWRYYTHDVNVFMKKLREGLSGRQDLQLGVKIFNDPEWGALSELY